MHLNYSRTAHVEKRTLELQANALSKTAQDIPIDKMFNKYEQNILPEEVADTD